MIRRMIKEDLQELFFTQVNMHLRLSSMKKMVSNCRKEPFVCIVNEAIKKLKKAMISRYKYYGVTQDQIRFL